MCSNLIVDLKLSFVCVYIFCFRKKKYVTEKSGKSKISSRLLAYTYTCVPCTRIRIYVCRDSVHLDSSGPPGVPSRLLGSHRVPHLRSVCVCAYTQTYTPIYTPTRVQNRKDTDNTPMVPSVKNNPPRQATSAFID